MDFNSELVALQGVILSIDNKHQFRKITARGGNEKKIETIIKLLQDFLSEKQYDQDLDEKKAAQLRNFAFYLVLNADLEILKELVEFNELSSVIQTIPAIPKCLLGEMLWGLNMKSFISEIIIFTHPQLSLEVAEVLIDHFKYFHPTQCLENLKILVTACYKFIFRLIFFHIKSIELKRAINNFYNCLKYFKEPPNVKKLETLELDDMSKCAGNHLYTLLVTLNDCFSEYVKTQTIEVPTSYSVYELSYDEESMNDIEEYTVLNCSNDGVKESIENCNIALLDTCKDLVKEVSVEVFCGWSEFEENGISLQQTIGQLCYKLKKKLENIPTVCEHALLNMLDQISCEPLDCVQIINKIESQAIVNNIIKNDEEKDKWIRAILHRNNVCNDTILIEQLISNISILNEEECHNLFKLCRKHIIEESDVHEQTKLLLIKAFQECNEKRKFYLLHEHFGSTFSDDLLTEQFSQLSVEIFNKLTMSPDADLSEVLVLFLQSPKKLYNKVFHLAVENGEQTEMMVKVMKYLNIFTDYYYNHETQSCIISLLKEIMESDMDVPKSIYYSNFIITLNFENIISESKLLLLIIMPCLYNSLFSRNIKCINILCLILSKIFPLPEVIQYRVPMMAMLGQVLDTVRWNITNYHPMSPPTVEYAVDCLLSILRTYEQQIPEKEVSWLKVKLRNIDPLNLYYFRGLWNPPGDTFLEVTTGIRIYKDMDIEQLTAQLSKILCSTTAREWIHIWRDLAIFSKKRLFKIINEAILLIALAEKKHQTVETWDCLMYCIDNFILITRYHYLGNKIDKNQIKDVMHKFILFEHFVEEENVENFSYKVMPVFSYLVEKKEDVNIYSIWNSLCDQVKNKSFLEFINKNIFDLKQ